MLWWDWTGAQKLRLMALMLCLAAAPWLLVGMLTHQWKALPGGTAFLLIPQIVGWLLFVGLKTGRMPVRGGSESRADSPTWFWIVAALYGGLLAVFFGSVLLIVTEIAIS